MAHLKFPASDFALKAAPPSGEVGATLGGYQLLNTIAEGTFCTVQRARAASLGAGRGEVAIKRLRTDRRDGRARARLVREARLGLALRSPNLVRVYELHTAPELFIVMELVQGATLHQLLQHEKTLSQLRMVLPMFVDTLYGLAALHHCQDEDGVPSFLVHQAPTPSNMLVGCDGVTRLIDLSTAHTPRPDGKVVRPPASTSLAPEQTSADAQIDPRCDIFVVGCALHGVLEQAVTARGAAREGDLRIRLRKLFAVAERARARRRSERYWSAEEMAFRLQQAARELGLLAGPQELGGWLRSMLAVETATDAAWPELLAAENTAARALLSVTRAPIRGTPTAARPPELPRRASVPGPSLRPRPVPALPPPVPSASRPSTPPFALARESMPRVRSAWVAPRPTAEDSRPAAKSAARGEAARGTETFARSAAPLLQISFGQRQWSVSRANLTTTLATLVIVALVAIAARWVERPVTAAARFYADHTRPAAGAEQPALPTVTPLTQPPRRRAPARAKPASKAPPPAYERSDKRATHGDGAVFENPAEPEVPWSVFEEAPRRPTQLRTELPSNPY